MTKPKTLEGAVKIYAQNCLQAPAELFASGVTNRQMSGVHSRK